MSEIKTNLKLKTASNTYTQKYPISQADIVRRDTTQVTNILGSNLQECLQTTANRYCPQNGKDWVEFAPPATSGNKAICSDGNFVFVKVGSQCKWSFDGGKTFVGSGVVNAFASATIMNCKRVKVNGVLFSYHVAVALPNQVQSIRIDSDDVGITYTNTPITTTISSPNSIFFTDGAWYVYGADKVATIIDLNGGVPVETQPSGHSHMSKAIYAPDMGAYVTIDNGKVVISNAKVGGN